MEIYVEIDVGTDVEIYVEIDTKIDMKIKLIQIFAISQESPDI